MSEKREQDTNQLSEQERLEQQRRHQQANWFMGGFLFVLFAAAGNALSTATANKMFLVGGFAIGAIAAWAVNKYVK